MAPQKKTPSLQDILKRRQRSDFVGREEQITLFRRNLALRLDDERRRFVFNVSGQGGVDKTWLLRRFRQMADNDGGHPDLDGRPGLKAVCFSLGHVT